MLSSVMYMRLKNYLAALGVIFFIYKTAYLKTIPLIMEIGCHLVSNRHVNLANIFSFKTKYLSTSTAFYDFHGASYREKINCTMSSIQVQIHKICRRETSCQ